MVFCKVYLTYAAFVIFTVIVRSPCAAAANCPLPRTGCEVEYLAAVDDLVTEYLCDRFIPGATISIMKDGVVVYERGFGFADEHLTVALQPDAMMRVASVSKPMTAAAIRVLIDDGSLTLVTRAFDVGQPNGGVLPLDPFPSLGDPRLGDITINTLLGHTGGWNRGIAGDLTYREVIIANAMGIEYPPGREDVMRYILGQPLEHTPGSEYSYSNIGYLALGLIVEEISGMPLIDFIHQRVLNPLGVSQSEFEAGRTFLIHQNPREPFYHSTGTATNVFDPQGPSVLVPYGGWDHEARVGQGGQITTTRTLLAYLDARYISGSLIGLELPPSQSTAWRRNHTGSLPGTESLARQRGDGIRYAVIFNQRATSSPNNAYGIRLQIDELFDSGTIDWPADLSEPCGNPFDLNGDGVLNFFDISVLLNAMGEQCADCDNCPADLSPNCQIDFYDLSALLQAFF